ncbi:MAG: L-threonylcarbamoyladenylate synthase [Sphingomonadales bacterium]
MTFRPNIAAASPQAINAAAAALRRGDLVSFPTETVYGLGADATSDQAIAAIFEVKNRPSFNPLIVHVAAFDQAREIVIFDERALKLAEAFWPGSLTLVAPRAPGCKVSLLASAGLDTLAVRSPDHPVAHDLLCAARLPIAAPSANISGKISPTTAEHVASDLAGRIDHILDGGPCRVGIESTVVKTTPQGAVLLRPGGVTQTEIEQVLGERLLKPVVNVANPDAPGQLTSHYAPSLPVRLGATEVASTEALLAFGPPLVGAARTLNLSTSSDLREAAANLFAMMRALDDPALSAIAVMAVPQTGLGRAINDRLRRAASK